MFAHLVQRQVKDVSQCLHCTVSQTKLFNNPSTGQTQTTNQTQAVLATINLPPSSGEEEFPGPDKAP